MDVPVKTFTQGILARLNRKAIKAGANRTLRVQVVKRLSPANVYPISQALLHNDTDIRCTIVLNEKGDTAELDVTLDDYNRLPTVVMPRP